MSQACYQVSLGLLLILIDIRIEMLDIFPDILGYILILTGLYRLKRNSKYFGFGYGAAWLLLVVSCIQFLMTVEQQQVGSDQIGMVSPMDYGLQFIPLIGNIILGYGICKGIELRAEELRQAVLKQSARTRLGFYLIIHLLWLIAMPFGLNVNEDIIISLHFVFALGMIISLLSILLLARAAGRLWREGHGELHK